MSDATGHSVARTLRDQQRRLSRLADKVDSIKRKYFPEEETSRSRTRLKQAEQKALKKETDCLETDIAFIRSVLEGVADLEPSPTTRFFKKVLPGKMFSPLKDVSLEFRTSLMAFTTTFFEDKVKSLECSIRKNRLLRKKNNSKDNEDGDTCTLYSHSGDSNAPGKKEEEAVCYSKYLEENVQPNPGLCRPVQNIFPQQIHFVSTEVEVKMEEDPADITPHFVTFESYSSRCVDCSVQTESSASKGSCMSSEKCIQTEGSLQPVIMTEILEALKKINEEYVGSEKSVSMDGEISVDSCSLREWAVTVPLRLEGLSLHEQRPVLVLPATYHLREVEWAQVEETGPLLSVQLSRVLTAEDSTLQIDYSRSRERAGRIVITDFGSEQSDTQSEIVGRIVTYLIGLSPPRDKT